MKLKDKVCIITGGAMGIGRATAEKSAEEGAKVIICDMNEDAGKATASAINADFYKVNVTDRKAAQDFVDAVVAKYGRVDVLVNNAGIVRDARLVVVKDGQLVKQMSEADFDLVIGVNLKGVFNCSQAVAPYMVKQGGGVILSASSVVGLDGNFGQTNYVATKAAVIGMTKVWARELGPAGVRANAVAPGFTATDILKDMPDTVLQGMVNKTPMRRIGQPRDIANAYCFLASDEASFINGHVLRVDGGLVVGT